MSKRNDKDYLSDIQEAIIKVQQYVEGYDFKRFLEDSKTQDAVVRNLEVIGEASKKVSAPLKMNYLDVPWKDLAGIRDRLVHHYFGINYEEELPEVLAQIRAILKNG